MKKITKFIIPLVIFFMLIMPIFSFASVVNPNEPCNASTVNASTNQPCQLTTGGGLVPCDGVNCDFKAFMNLINKIIKFILFDMVVPIAAIMFVYAGFLLVTAGGETAGARTKAKTIFTNAIIGLVLAMAAWLIIRTILLILGYSGDWIGF